MEQELLKTKEQNERLKKLLIEAAIYLRPKFFGGLERIPETTGFRNIQFIERIEK